MREPIRLRFCVPGEQAGLWRAYVDGARRHYRARGVEHALRIPDEVTAGRPFFAVALRGDDVVGGWHTPGRLAAVADSFAVGEVAANPVAVERVTRWMAERLAEGMIEIKALWADAPEGAGRPASSSTAGLLVRGIVHATGLLRVRYAIGTTAEHAARRHARGGARIMDDVEPVPFPDVRYRTRFLWWDRDESPGLLAPDQRELFEAERRELGARVTTGRAMTGCVTTGWATTGRAGPAAGRDGRHCGKPRARALASALTRELAPEGVQ